MMADSNNLKDIPLHIFRPTEYLSAHLSNNVRPDGRTLLAPRPVGIKTGPLQNEANGITSVQVQVGNTIILAVPKVLVGTPTLSTPSNGDICCKITFDHLFPSSLLNVRAEDELSTSSGNSSTFGELVASVPEVEYMLNSTLNRGSIIELSQLSILEGNYAYRIEIHLIAMSYGGNLRDACFLAAMAGLKAVQVPKPIVDPNDESLTVDYSITQSLSLLASSVVSVTIGIVQVQLILDPTDREEAVMDGIITNIINAADGKILHSLTNSIERGISIAMLKEVQSVSVEHAKRLVAELGW